MSPLERLEAISKRIPNTQPVIQNIENEYEWFLRLREQGSEWWKTEGNKESAFKHADYFHKLIVRDFMKEVVITNVELSNRTELYCLENAL